MESTGRRKANREKRLASTTVRQLESIVRLGACCFRCTLLSRSVQIRQAEGDGEHIPASIADPLTCIKSPTLPHELGDYGRYGIAVSLTVRIQAWYAARQVVYVANAAPLAAPKSTLMFSLKPKSPYFRILREQAR